MGDQPWQVYVDLVDGADFVYGSYPSEASATETALSLMGGKIMVATVSPGPLGPITSFYPLSNVKAITVQPVIYNKINS